MPRSTDLHPNLAAFLDMLAASEIGPDLMEKTDDGYNVLAGATPNHPLTFSSYATHPNILNTRCDSTASGRYQLLHRYYSPYCILLGLTDFSPISQDKIAIQQIKECHAIPDILAGNLQESIHLCNHLWASLFGSPYGQHTNSIEYLQAAYTKSGGVLA